MQLVWDILFHHVVARWIDVECYRNLEVARDVFTDIGDIVLRDLFK